MASIKLVQFAVSVRDSLYGRYSANKKLAFSKLLGRASDKGFYLQNFFLTQIIAQKTAFSAEDFFSKCERIHIKRRIWSHLLNKSLMEKSIFVS